MIPFRTPYEIEKEYLLLDNTCSNDIIIPIEDYYSEKGLTGITVMSNNSSLKNFEYIQVNSIQSFDLGPVNQYYVSIYEPIFIVDAIHREISKKEKDILYEYTSSHWDLIIDTFKRMYFDSYNYRKITEFNPNKKINEIIWPDKSPDYRLLPDYKK